MTHSTFKYVVLATLAVAWLVLVPATAAQPASLLGSGESIDERGLPFPSEHFAPPNYQQAPQNWAVVQDDRGLIYVANNDGVLQYDGQRWRLIPTSTGALVRSLSADSLIYVGAKEDFGYLRPDSLGSLQYRSLYEQIPEGERDFGDVWKTHTTSEGVYYQASERLFRWDGEEITSWTSETSFHTSFTVGDTLYVRASDRGLLKMKNDSLRLDNGGDLFSDRPIHLMAPHPSGDLLVATENEGLYLYDGQTARPFAPHLTSHFEEHDLYHGCTLPGDRYALATLGGGVLIIGADGQILRSFDQSTELPDEVVNYVYPGSNGGLWMALNNDGIYRANISAPTTLHDDRTGLNGVIHTVNRHDGRLHVATGSGLYVLRQGEEGSEREGRARFEKRGGMPLAWDLLSAGESHLAGTNNGVYRIDEPEAKKLTEGYTYALTKSEQTGLIYAGTRSGIKVLRPTQEGWKPHSVEGIGEEIRSLTTGPEGSLWAATVHGKVVRVTFSEDHSRVVEKTVLGEDNGLPEGYKAPMTIGDRIAVRSEQGLFQIENPEADPQGWRFAPQPSLLPASPNGSASSVIRSFFEDDQGTLWAALGPQVFKSSEPRTDRPVWRPVRPLHFPKPDLVGFHVEPDSTVWLAAGQDLIRYAPEPDRPSTKTSPFRTLVRKVTLLSEERVVYGGDSGLEQDSSLTLPYAENGFRIEVAAPFYGTTTPHQYQYKLTGQSDGWSEWTRTASTTYADLWEGTYQFRARARNSKGEVSQVRTFTLRIQPPWYRSKWAYLLYGFGVVLLFLGARHYQNIRRDQLRAHRQAKKLEREQEAKRKLKKANKRLQEANRLKEEFLANTSHELRTPLTNILGFVDVLRETPPEEQEQFLDALEKNGKRLKRTLDALLSLSRLRSENGQTDLKSKNVSQCTRQMASELQKDAEEKGLSLRVDIPSAPAYARANEQYLRQILRNLIENAIKYTEEGSVSVSVTETEEEVRVEVSDTGIGIDDEFLPEVFEEFKQESQGKSRTYEGYGLGLAISARLASLMGGKISVESEKGVGSTFTVHLAPAPAPQKKDGEESPTGESVTTGVQHPR